MPVPHYIKKREISNSKKKRNVDYQADSKGLTSSLK